MTLKLLERPDLRDWRLSLVVEPLVEPLHDALRKFYQDVDLGPLTDARKRRLREALGQFVGSDMEPDKCAVCGTQYVRPGDIYCADPLCSIDAETDHA